MNIAGYKKVALLAGAIAVVLVAIVLAIPTLKPAEVPPPARVASDVAINVSLIQLISTPERFDGRRVVVSGFLVNEPDDQSLYLSANDAINGLDNKVGVRFLGTVVPAERLEQLNREYVAVRGMFKGGSQPEINTIDNLDERHGAVKRPPLGE
jgi:hypothetical protein